MQNLQITKQEIREYLKSIPIKDELILNEEYILMQKAKNYLINNRIKIAGLYYPMIKEPNISQLHSFCNTNAIATAYPIIKSNNCIEFKLTHNLNDLKKNHFNFFEPSSENLTVFPDLIIVPGVAFSTNGTRLGKGQGHFDKYLSNHKTNTISLAFSWMKIEEIPKENHDIRIQKIFWANN